MVFVIEPYLQVTLVMKKEANYSKLSPGHNYFSLVALFMFLFAGPCGAEGGKAKETAYAETCSAKITWEEAQDVDNNSLADYLKVVLTINIPYEDTYTIEVKLFANDNTPLGVAALDPAQVNNGSPLEGFLHRGPNRFTVFFPVNGIRKLETESQLTVNTIIHDSGKRLVGNFFNKTNKYRSSQFQPDLFIVKTTEVIPSKEIDGEREAIILRLTGYASEIGNITVRYKLMLGEEVLAEDWKKERLSRGRQELIFQAPFPSSINPQDEEKLSFHVQLEEATRTRTINVPYQKEKN